MLGFTTWAVVFAMEKRYLMASLSFVCALCFKQMALFYALAFFFYLLGICYAKGRRTGTSLLLKIGITVILGFSLVLVPFVLSESAHSPLDNVVQIFRRVFPFHRGLWEDKVANFWCSLNLLVKLRKLYELETLARMSAAFTLMSALPSCFMVFKRPTTKQFVYTLLTCSFSFFLFSFQVHEKSILLPALPCMLLLGLDEDSSAMFVLWFNNVAMFRYVLSFCCFCLKISIRTSTELLLYEQHVPTVEKRWMLSWLPVDFNTLESEYVSDLLYQIEINA